MLGAGCVIGLADVPSSLPGDEAPWRRTERAELTRDNEGRYFLDVPRYGIISFDAFAGEIKKRQALKWAEEQWGI